MITSLPETTSAAPVVPGMRWRMTPYTVRVVVVATPVASKPLLTTTALIFAVARSCKPVEELAS
jgi:hypothetical protein